MALSEILTAKRMAVQSLGFLRLGSMHAEAKFKIVSLHIRVGVGQ